MAKSISILIADQMVADLNASGLTPAFTAARRFLPRNELKGLAAGGYKVLIAPSDRQGERDTRGSRAYTHSIDLALLGKITTEESAEQEAIDKLIEDLTDWYFWNDLGGDRPERLDTVASKYLFDPGSLLEQKVFLSVTTYNWLATRE